MNRLIHELSAGLTAVGRSMVRGFAQSFLLALVFMVTLGLLGKSTAHAGVVDSPAAVSLSQQAVFVLSSAPLSEEEQVPHDLPPSFLGEALDLDLEIKDLLGLRPVYSSVSTLDNNTAQHVLARRPLTEQDAFSERHHSPIFIFLQIFRL